MIVLDTTMLLYARGSEHHLQGRCQRVLRAHAVGQVQLTTTVEVLQEFTHVYSRRRPRSEAASLAWQFASAFDLLAAAPVDLSVGLRLYQQVDRLGAFDAVLAAVALNHGAEALLSADRAFGLVPGLKWIDPASQAFIELLER